MRRIAPSFTGLVLALALLFVPAPSHADDGDLTPLPKRVDLALCLDTSGSMSGLINAAREKLWKVIEELSMLQPMPDLRVALLTFGSPGNDATGHVIVQTPLTVDLDLVSDKLFGLKTNGGTEYVGRVMQVALEKLSWSNQPGLKLLFVAGNESADQDPVARFRVQAAIAKERGVAVNSIYCGGADDADAGSWRELASLANGRFANIDHNNGTVRVATPYDAKLVELSGKLNETYVFYGRNRLEKKKQQVRQDANAERAAPGAAADRAAAKVSGLYRVGTDLVESMGKKDFDLAKVSEAELPEKLRSMTLDERKAYLAAQARARADIAQQVKELNRKRADYIRADMKRNKLDDSKSLDRALRDAIREQAAREGFTPRPAK